MAKTSITWESSTSNEQNIPIVYGSSPSPFGQCFLAVTERGICKLAFFDTAAEKKRLIQELQNEWGTGNIVEDEAPLKILAQTIFDRDKDRNIKLLLKGSSFQLKVWNTLLSIPEGNLIPYQQIAQSIEQPKAVRAVASAIANNSIAYLIPCHRVIRKNGDFGQYRWGRERKRSLIAWECKSKEFFN
ncbi:MAG: methylated-DNA--[protein]-cysteine S-methyltransferase [Gammaproteobacteria bacterium]